MSAFGKYKRSCDSSSGGSSSGGSGGSGGSAFAAYQQPQKNTGSKNTGARKKQAVVAAPSDSEDPEEHVLESFLPKDDSDGDDALAPLMKSGMGMQKKKPARVCKDLTSEEHDYVRDHCLVPRESLKTFADVHGARYARLFAEQYQPESDGGTRAISGLLLFGPSGTGKSLLAQAITSHIGGTMYTLSGADLPNGKAGAQIIDALFEVALAGEKPAVIFIDECDTLLSVTAKARVGHFAKNWERFMENLLVIGATNEPTNIAPKLLTGRFERKIFVDNPNSAARRNMLNRQLAEEDVPHQLSASDLGCLVEATAGRSGVNMERLISSACMAAAGLPVSRDHFETALNAEPSDFDEATAKKNAKFDKKHGWHPSA